MGDKVACITRDPGAELGILHHRMSRAEKEIEKEAAARERLDAEHASQLRQHRELIQEIKNKNHITDFVRDNWKVLLVLYAIAVQDSAAGLLDMVTQLIK